jgi:succinate dehydrogenase / fumarate reductase cytochrome b subunit
MINTTFYLRRLHSICGLLALGGMLMEHIFTNSMALGGPAAFNGALAMMELIPHPIFLGIEVGLIGVPFLFHGIYGLYIALQAKNNTGSYKYVRNWQFLLQRCTAWYLVFFLIWHVGYLRVFTKGISGVPISYELVQSYVSNPIIFVLYVIAMFAAIFHLCNGITTFCMTWGIAKGPRIQCVIDKLCMLLALFLCLVTVAYMVHYLL